MQESSYTTKCGKDVLINREFRFKRLTLKFSKRKNSYVVTAPFFVSLEKIIAFIESAKSWFAKVEHVKKSEAIKKITPGQCINVLGQSLQVNFYPNPKSLTLISNDILEVHGSSSKFEIILLSYLKNLAKEKCFHYSSIYAKELKVEFHKLTVKEMRTRFGSCTSRKHLNYCWRIVMAPEHILAYLCAHEVAHLKEMNHSKKFWKLVEKICPDYKSSRKWLKQHGHELYKNFHKA